MSTNEIFLLRKRCEGLEDLCELKDRALELADKRLARLGLSENSKIRTEINDAKELEIRREDGILQIKLQEDNHDNTIMSVLP
jgi:hypothetical protein